MSLQEKLEFLFQHSGFQQEPLKVLFRLAFWYVRARLPRPASITLGRWKLTMEIPPRWKGVSKLIYVFREHYEPELFALEQLVPKGSVAVDGVSLTLVNVENDWFSVALIPHTLEHTTLGTLEVGHPVNIETDLLAKYVERQLETWPSLPTLVTQRP